MLNNRVVGLMEAYAHHVWSSRNGYSDGLSKAHEIADKLEAEYGIFAQVRGISHALSTDEMLAVFYSGRAAWKDHKEPFMTIAIQRCSRLA